MSNIFLVSDHHFGHQNSCLWLREDGITKQRPFDTSDECDEIMIERHNAIVKPGDKVYFLGDLAMSKKHLPKIAKLNGTKILIKGNHDQEKLSVYLEYFKDVRASHQLDKMLLTHIPIHPGSLSRWKANVHGHTHTGNVMLDDGTKDKRYICVCVEQINFTPVSLEELKTLST